jgi:hypothetical protein
MPLPAIRVELAFNEKGPGNFFTLGDVVKGVLGNSTFLLAGGTNFFDVTEHLESLSISRGKSRALDRYQSGNLRVEFNNRNRFFDPTYSSSPYFGQIVPRRDIRIWINNLIAFVGTIDDWDLQYAPNGQSTASASAYDGFNFLAGQTLTAGTFTSQKSGARIAAVLADPSVAWPFGSTVDTGSATLQGDSVTAEDNALQYLQVVESTEPGDLFVARDGKLTFYDRSRVVPSSAAPVLTDATGGIKYAQIRATYGSELLFTQSEVTRKGDSTIVQANDLPSQDLYGIRTLSSDNLLSNNLTDLSELAIYLVGQYSQPEYRFDQVEVILSQLSQSEQNTLLALDLGSVCKVVFTPNGVGSAIEKYAKVIAVSHNANITEHRMSLGLGTLAANSFVLDDVGFGILDVNVLGW